MSSYPDGVDFNPTNPTVKHSLVPIFVSAAFVIIVLLFLTVYFYCKSKHNNNNNPPPPNMELELQGIGTPVAAAAPVGVPPEVRKGIPWITYSEDFETPHGEKICALCQDDFEHGDQISIFPRCSHVLHAECMDKYLNHSETLCLYCRLAICIPTPPVEESVGTSTSAAAAAAAAATDEEDASINISVSIHP
ncbi:RING-H2 finger protein ATL79-like [Ziziphus jujuba]|uniref:RING-type E3 ubiquitin transferase n=1 Tax=Ziziphus jujuba TaxID=326968 RepID=A0ABM4AAX0_ZIZJJ|nr:RING-H2 finger protein ATL79-like [Ziziphus jujuba]